MNQTGVVGLYVRMGEIVADAIEDHEARLHVPPAKRGPLTVIPFPDVNMTEVQVARARELQENGMGLYEVAAVLEVPISVLERELADFNARWRRFLHERETAV